MNISLIVLLQFCLLNTSNWTLCSYSLLQSVEQHFFLRLSYDGHKVVRAKVSCSWGVEAHLFIVTWREHWSHIHCGSVERRTRLTSSWCVQDNVADDVDNQGWERGPGGCLAPAQRHWHLWLLETGLEPKLVVILKIVYSGSAWPICGYQDIAGAAWGAWRLVGAARDCLERDDRRCGRAHGGREGSA